MDRRSSFPPARRRGWGPAAVRGVVGTIRGFVTTDEPISRDAGTHVTYLALMVFFLAAPALLTFEPGRDARVSILSLRLASSCLSHEVLGFECPGCGLARSFVLIIHGRLRDSLRYHRLGIVLYCFFLYQAGFRAYCLRNLKRAYPLFVLRLQRCAPSGLIMLFVVNWVIGIFAGSNGS